MSIATPKKDNCASISLRNEHQEVLKTRGITTDYAIMCGVSSWSGPDDHEYLDKYQINRLKRDFPGMPLHKYGTGTLIRYMVPSTDKIARARIRLDVTELEVSEEDGNEGVRSHSAKTVDLPRYVAQNDVPVTIYRPAFVRIDGELVEWETVAKDTSIPLHVTEAPLKALSLCDNGMPAIGLGGVLAGPQAKGRESNGLVDPKNPTLKVRPHPDLETIDWRGREAFIVFDASITRNALVALGAARLAHLLRGLCAIVKLVTIPYEDKLDANDLTDEVALAKGATDQGPDDYIFRHGADALRERVAEAVPADVETYVRAYEGETGPLVQSLYVRAYLSEASAASFEMAASALKKLKITKETTRALVREFRQVLRSNAIEAAEWQAKLTTNVVGQPRATRHNIRVVLAESQLAGFLGYNLFSQAPVKLTTPPWADDFKSTAGDKEQDWTDEDTIRLCCYLESNFGLVDPKKDMVNDIVEVVSRELTFHPVRQYFDSVAWDGVARLDTWLTDYLHVEASPYSRMVARKWLISAVARTYEPGCQADYVLVLEGDQRIGKSTALRTLALDKWHSEPNMGSLDNKEAVMLTQSCLILEFGEGHVLRKADATRLKQFITTRWDDIILKFGNRKRRYPRGCVLAMTVNPDEYLTDTTGNARYWPVDCGKEMVDTEGLASVRDMLWAEAVAAYRAGEQWHPTDEQLAVAKGEQQMREVSDPWELPIRQYLTTVSVTSVYSVITVALSLQARDHNPANSKRVTAIMRKLGWVQPRELRTKTAKLWQPGPDAIGQLTEAELAVVTVTKAYDTGAGIVVDNENVNLPSVDDLA